MKKGTVILLSLVLLLALAACGQNKDSTSAGTAPGAKEVTLKVGASSVPHAEILKSVQKALKAQGVNLEIKEFSDYVQPNVQVFEKQLDANFFQHQPYLDKFNSENKMNLVKVVGVHIEPLGAYSTKIKKLDELKDGASIGIPNDATNGGRALALLQKQGFIKLKDGVGVEAKVKDIVENPKKLKLKELEAAMLPRMLPEVDLAVINTNYVLAAQMNPTKEALFMEDKESPYVNILVARPDNKDSEAMQKLAKALNTPEVKQFIQDKYSGAVIPAFGVIL